MWKRTDTSYKYVKAFLPQICFLQGLFLPTALLLVSGLQGKKLSSTLSPFLLPLGHPPSTMLLQPNNITDQLPGLSKYFDTWYHM